MIFYKWSDGNTENPRNYRIPSTSNNLYAKYKGIQISNDVNAYKSNSQRKFVQTDDGYQHTVYESMGHVWYERSTDNGSTWFLANNNKPLDVNGGKLPSIDYRGNDVAIVWQEKYGGGAVYLKVAYFEGYLMYPYYPKTVFVDLTQSYTQNLNPVIAYDYNGRAIVAWENKSNSTGYPILPIGIVVAYGPLGRAYPFDPPEWTTFDAVAIPSTNSNCVNPTISAAKNPTDQYNLVYNLAWQLNESSIFSSIKYCKISVNGSQELNVSSISTISSGSGYLSNKSPSLALKNERPYVVWVGDGEMEEDGKVRKTARVPFGKRVVMRFQDSNGWVSTFRKYGIDVQNPNINNLSGSIEGYSFGWSEVSNSAVKYVNGTNIYNIYQTKSSGLTGNYVQLSNGDNFQEMFLHSFNNSSLPYSFDLTTVESTTKSSTISQRFGREGILSYGRTEYYFAVADILNGEEVIEFVDLEDSPALTIDELNDALYTKAFMVLEGTPVYFSVMYGIADTTGTADLSEAEYVNYAVELIDESTGEVIGEYDNVTYDAENTSGRKLVAYEINTEGIGSREVRLRLAVNTNTDAVYTLGELVNDEQIITKQGTKTISYAGSLEVKEYALSQNYPNPFNPTTNIMYQLPKEGRVVIKLYDILGREIQTLVNKHQPQGRYEFTFDGGKLSSGVYIYRITSGEFTASKKFILMK
ncbi:MAG: T9SS type A sorting domain-containing protein [Melioribacteraceae bacterium]|nr:T9SS type A sorting domain-containing protein [Melioribacteraceae bacterium]MCF8356816.1 T9SS type A sorting domain-containing protein [Melioribacteraceae bacterium]MCF8418159.1 T9SS type A sorting domain-containing protein [Melioribacteraceae bacterium]